MLRYSVHLQNMDTNQENLIRGCINADNVQKHQAYIFQMASIINQSNKNRESTKSKQIQNTVLTRAFLMIVFTCATYYIVMPIISKIKIEEIEDWKFKNNFTLEYISYTIHIHIHTQEIYIRKLGKDCRASVGQDETNINKYVITTTERMPCTICFRCERYDQISPIFITVLLGVRE